MSEVDDHEAEWWAKVSKRPDACQECGTTAWMPTLGRWVCGAKWEPMSFTGSWACAEIKKLRQQIELLKSGPKPYLEGTEFTIGTQSDDSVSFDGEEYSIGAHAIVTLPNNTRIHIDPDYNSGWEFKVKVPHGSVMHVIDPWAKTVSKGN
jgi:hypothetical protein